MSTENNENKRITEEPLATIDISTPYIDASVQKSKKKKKIGKIIGISVGAVVLGTYLIGAAHNFFFFENNSRINGVDVSNKSITQVLSIMTDEANAYKLDVNFSNGTEELSVANGDLNISLEKSVRAIKNEHNALLWPAYLQGGYDYEVNYVTEINEDKLVQTIKSWKETDPSNMTKSVNAKVVMDGGEAQIIDDITGTELDVDVLVETCKDAVTNVDTELNIEDTACYIKAEIQSDAEIIKKQLKACEDYLNLDAKYDFKGYTVDIPKDELAKMVYLDQSGTIQVSEANVKAYVKRFAAKYSTAGTERDFKTHNGDMIKIYGGWYGWVIDEEAEAEELFAYLKSKRSFTKAPVCEREGYAMGEMNDIGENYVEIDLTNQHVYVYSKGMRVFDTPCVSGCVNRGMSTPGGLYPLTYKQLNATLRGPGYATPVAYWMPFNGGIGMHDATWKTKFGEDYYIYDGSHGCINLPLDAASIIYDYVEQGSPVVCYWEDEVGISH